MVLAECLFQIEKCNDMTAMSNGVYDFWSVDEKGIYYFFSRGTKYEILDANYFTDSLCGFEFTSCEMRFVDWQNLQPLFSVDISDESEIPVRDPLMCNQLIVIRGACSGQCSKSIKPLDGYTTRLIPSCEPVRLVTDNGNALFIARQNDAEFELHNLKADQNVKIGTAVFSHNYASFIDMFFDAVYWALCCPCVDAVIFNLDMYPEVSRPVTDYAYAAIHIKNRQLKVVKGETLKKLYREYCKYPAMDYSMEEQITELSGFYFRFERGTKKCKV